MRVDRWDFVAYLVTAFCFGGCVGAGVELEHLAPRLKATGCKCRLLPVCNCGDGPDCRCVELPRDAR